MDLRGVNTAVGRESEKVDGGVCAINLYIEAANCGRRCNPESRVTFYVFAGASPSMSRGEVNGPLGSLGGKLDGPIGLAIAGYLYLMGPELQAENRYAFGKWWIYGLAAKYAAELVGDFVGQPILKLASNWLSVFAIVFGFPNWAYTCWRIYDYYMENDEFPYYYDGSTETIYAELLFYSAPVIE